jgi:hypothetical protein
MPDGSVRGQLLAKVDELTASMTSQLDAVRAVTEQLAPERARSCRNAITMCSVMIDEIRYGPTPGRSTSPNPTEIRGFLLPRPSAYGSGGGSASTGRLVRRPFG